MAFVKLKDMSLNRLKSIANEQTSEVYVANDKIVKPTIEIVKELKRKANNNPNKKCRLLLHQNIDDSLHQMLIVHSKGQYIRPHKNAHSAKSWQVVEGELILVLFKDDGSLIEHILMSSVSRGYAFIVRLSESYFHTLIPLTNKTVILETILGPFRGTVYAPWAPSEEDAIAASIYFKEICLKIGIHF